ncbi:MAG TPA: sulfatase-like hydrolase/transferase [Candidatus Acidoferrum sp.]|jgi:arylsulfatase A-like enzyme|nr:sulfatase-like hydrolase/transferase [Candidatus Acidoferrum sp.]
MKPIRLLSCLLAALAAFQFSAVAQSAHPMPRRPNIILVVADGLSANDLSCYGQTQFQTPNLDKLAAEGIRFTHYSAGAAESSAACADLMLGTGSAPTNGDFTLGQADVTIAQVLKNSGYWTGLIGEWNLGGQSSIGSPWLKGFDEFAGYLTPGDAANAYSEFIWRYEHNPTNDSVAVFNGPEVIYDNTGGKQGKYIPDWQMTLAMNFTKKHQPFYFNHYQPFFLVLHYAIPGNGNRVVPTDAPFSEESWPQAEKNRAAAISRLDGYIGQLLQQLDKISQASNTVVFFTSDTVPRKADGTDPKFFHENSPSDSLRVPMIVHCPGKIPAGQVSDLDCSARDFLPTAAGIGLVQPPENSEGVSFLSVLLGQGSK